MADYNVVMNCSMLLETINPPFQALLIDTHILQNLGEIMCKQRQKVRLAVNVELLKSIRKKDYKEYDIVYYQNFSDKDYLRVYEHDTTRIIPKIPLNINGNLSISGNVTMFLEAWKRSKFIDCLGLNMRRQSAGKPYLPVEKSVQVMSSLMRYLITFDVYPFLFCGSMLGWYRECNIIPHTMDIDFAAPIEEYTPELLEDLASGGKFFLHRKFGLPNDSFEFTIKPKDKSRPTVDLFWVYTTSNESWVGGTSGDGTKYKYTYPLLNETCACDLLGHIFWVPCNPREVLEAEYGPKWYLDHPTESFSWSSSQHNVKKNGKWPSSLMTEVYNIFQ
nr:LicD domain containing protein [Haemonchus contortus]